MQNEQNGNAIKPSRIQADKETTELFKIQEVSQPEELDPNLTDEELDRISAGTIIRVSPRMNCGAGTCCDDMKKH